MDAKTSAEPILEPPVEMPAFHMNDWFPIGPDDPVVDYLADQLWEQPDPPQAWEAARLSRAVYLYREKETLWTVLVKFYAAKTHTAASAERYAANEFERTCQAFGYGETNAVVRAPRALACCRGTLFLEYVDGLTLEDTIAIRRNRPGSLLPALEKTAELLSGLHGASPQPDLERKFRYEIADARELVDELAQHGVLEGNRLVVEALYRLIDRWAGDAAMTDYVPAHIHGDATVSNFVLSWSGGLVAIDWERMWTADPASELGRLLAEISHAIQQYGGNEAEADRVLDFTTRAYRSGLPADWDGEALLGRARFYRASSTLRIARNGWLPRLERTALVAQALSLLA